MLGCLIEKRWTTPDQYPLSLNALRLACNQSTNRDPVDRLRRAHGPRGGAAAVQVRPGAAGQRPLEPRDQVPPSRRGGARARPGGARRAGRAAAPRSADARRAERPLRADGAAGVARGGRPRARRPDRARLRAAARAPAGAEGGPLRATARRRERLREPCRAGGGSTRGRWRRPAGRAAVAVQAPGPTDGLRRARRGARGRGGVAARRAPRSGAARVD